MAGLLNCASLAIPESIKTYTTSANVPPKSQEANATAMPNGPHLPILSRFPPLQGPKRVGSLDLEIDSSIFALQEDRDPQIKFEKPKTILFRMFYPTEEPTKRPVYWIPEPYQKEYMYAYEEFSGTSHLRNMILGLMPRQISNIIINATEAAPPIDIEPRSPLVILSHSLGGSRHSYTYLATYLASHGCFVICPEHRDGSAAVSLVRDTLGTPQDDGWLWLAPLPAKVEHIRYDDTFTKPVEEGRLKQMAIRCWELQTLFRTLCRINAGDEIENFRVHVGCDLRSMCPTFLMKFKGMMNSVNTPGEVIWLGHGYGAAAIIQLHKSTYYPVPPELADQSLVIFAQPPRNCPLRNQITPQSSMILLDPWVFPLAFKQVRYLFRLRLPQMQATGNTPRSLCIMSDQFYAWREAMLCLRRIFNRNPMMCPLPLEKHRNSPLWYYIEKSGHGNQSDFGLLFNHHPGIDEQIEPSDPKWIMDINCKCILEYLKYELRLKDIPVGETEIIGNLLPASDLDRPWRWMSIRGDEWDMPDWEPVSAGYGETIGIRDSWFCNFMVTDEELAQFIVPGTEYEEEEIPRKEPNYGTPVWKPSVPNLVDDSKTVSTVKTAFLRAPAPQNVPASVGKILNSPALGRKPVSPPSQFEPKYKQRRPPPIRVPTPPQPRTRVKRSPSDVLTPDPTNISPSAKPTPSKMSGELPGLEVPPKDSTEPKKVPLLESAKRSHRTNPAFTLRLGRASSFSTAPAPRAPPRKTSLYFHKARPTMNIDVGRGASSIKSIATAQSSNINASIISKPARPLPSYAQSIPNSGFRGFTNLWGLLARPKNPPQPPKTEAEIVRDIGLSAVGIVPIRRSVRKSVRFAEDDGIFRETE